MNKHNYIIAVTLGLITLLWLGMLLYFETKYEAEYETYLDMRMTLFDDGIQGIIGTYEKFSNFIFESIINENDVTYLMKLASESDELEKEVYRNQLYKRFETIYQTTLDYDFRQLHFHLPTGESFLRMHTPDKYGDFLFDVRETIRVANTEKEIR